MKVLYISSTCSKQKYYEYVECRGERVSQQAQKYNWLLASGFAENGASVKVISSRPINQKISKKVWFRGEREQADGMTFNYLPFINRSLFRKASIFIGTFFKLLFSSLKVKETAVVCDALNVSMAAATLLASVLRGYKTVGIVTDVPCYFSNMENISHTQKFNLWLMKRFKSYLLLTEQMSEIVNLKNRPFIVLEGHADMGMAEVENILESKNGKKICLYAGSLMKIYGIKNLVEGFVKADIPDSELHIYGSGDYDQELKELVKVADNVKYFGIAPNSEIVKAEIAATLLVNPRPTNEEYTKYSFPSKNMEYMASGTPVLTTRLPGMPEDHKPYVFFIEDETADGVKEALENVFKNTPEQLHEFGLKAKQFILQQKNNKAQAGKVIKFLEKEMNLK